MHINLENLSSFPGCTFPKPNGSLKKCVDQRMQAASRLKEAVYKIGNPQIPSSPLLFSLFHSTPISPAKWKNKWDVTKDAGCSQQPSKSYVRYAVRQKRADAKKALKNLLLNGKPSRHYFQDEELVWCGEETTGRWKDGSHSCSKNPKRSKGKRRMSFYDDDDYHEQSEPKFSATFGGHRCYSWSFGSWENCNFDSSTHGFEWRENSKWENANRRVWSESDVEDDAADVRLHSHRVALGLPLTGSLKLDDVKSAFRACALKWHPDKHQGHAQAIAGEKFKLCVDAYKSLCNALKSTWDAGTH